MRLTISNLAGITSLVKFMSRILLVVVFLLLPVIMTGTSLEIPGANCDSHNCCMLARCSESHRHMEQENPGGVEHHHHRHAHERILLLRDAGMRDAHVCVSTPVCRTSPPCVYTVLSRLIGAMEPCATGAPPYCGYLSPLRC